MKFRVLGKTEINVSEVGFGVWTVATNWWGTITEEEGIRLLQKAYDLEINLFDTADTYGEGYGEEIVAKALGRKRHEIVLCTKFGYNFYEHLPREGHKELPQKFDPEFIRYACEQSLRRLGTDYIDLYQLHNPRIDTIGRDEVFNTLEELTMEGKIRYYGVALGPDIGWFEEGEASMKERNVPVLQTIYSILEQDPANSLFPIAKKHDTGLLTRVPHASGMLDGTYTKDTVFDDSDHRSHHRHQWLNESLQKISSLDFLIQNMKSTIGQIAIKFALAGTNVASVLPNITNFPQLDEFSAAPHTEDIPPEFLDQIADLYNKNFYVESVAEPSELG